MWCDKLTEAFIVRLDSVWLPGADAAACLPVAQFPGESFGAAWLLQWPCQLMLSKAASNLY